MPHIVSSDRQFATLKNGARIEKQKQDILSYIQAEESHLVFLEDGNELDPTVATKQMGRAMMSTDIEKRLVTILPSNVFFKDNPYINDKRVIMRTLGDKLETLVPMEKGWTPEHSIMQLVVKEIPDTDVIARNRAISRDGLPRSEWTKDGFVFEEGLRPGYKKIKQIGRELKRGYRTVLIKLIQMGLMSIYDAERLFSPDDSATWAQNLKGHDRITIW